MGVILFNGRSCKDFCMTVESRPPAAFPVRRGEVYEIEGSNGSHVQENGTFSNYVQPYKVWLGGRSAPLGARALSRGIAAWLLGSSGYCRLEDSYEPEHFRLARFAGPLNVEQLLQNFGRCTLEFDVRPERYLKDGENAVTLLENVNLSNQSQVLAAQATVKNLTGFPAKPIFRITGTGNVGFSCEPENVGDDMMIIALNLGSGGTVSIDCKSYQINCAPELVSFGTAYPVLATLQAGDNVVAATYGLTNPGTITKLEMIPRWWTL